MQSASADVVLSFSVSLSRGLAGDVHSLSLSWCCRSLPSGPCILPLSPWSCGRSVRPLFAVCRTCHISPLESFLLSFALRLISAHVAFVDQFSSGKKFKFSRKDFGHIFVFTFRVGHHGHRFVSRTVSNTGIGAGLCFVRRF